MILVGRRCIWTIVDVTKEDDVKHLISSAVQELGDLTVSQAPVTASNEKMEDV